MVKRASKPSPAFPYGDSPGNNSSRAQLTVGIVFDDTLDSNDGVSQQVKRLGEYLSKHGHKVFYLCGETKLRQWSGGKIYSLSKNIHIRFNGNRLSMPLYSSGRKIREVLRTEDPDLLHVMTPYSPLMAQRVIAAARRRDIMVVGSFHILPSGGLSSVGARLLGFLQFFSLRKISAFTSTSYNAALFARQTMRIKSVVVPNMVDIRAFSSGRKTDTKNDQIVFLGRLVERKGCAQLIRAFAALSKTKPETELVIAGDGPDRTKLERMAADLGVGHKVAFLGYIDEADKPKILGSAQIACFPALYGESFGLVLVEAMAAGAKVVLGGDNPGYRSVLGERPQQLIDPNDIDGFAKRLALFLTDGTEANQASDWQAGQLDEYDVETVGTQHLELYHRAIAKRHGFKA